TFHSFLSWRCYWMCLFLLLCNEQEPNVSILLILDMLLEVRFQNTLQRTSAQSFNPSYTGYATGSVVSVSNAPKLLRVSILLILDMLLEVFPERYPGGQ